MCNFELKTMRRGDIVVNQYEEGGESFGAVARVTNDPRRGPVIRFTTPLTFDGAAAIIERLRAATAEWPNPQLVGIVPAVTEPPREEPDLDLPE